MKWGRFVRARNWEGANEARKVTRSGELTTRHSTCRCSLFCPLRQESGPTALGSAVPLRQQLVEGPSGHHDPNLSVPSLFFNIDLIEGAGIVLCGGQAGVRAVGRACREEGERKAGRRGEVARI